MAEIIRLHRCVSRENVFPIAGVRPIPVEHLDNIFEMPLLEAQGGLPDSPVRPAIYNHRLDGPAYHLTCGEELQAEAVRCLTARAGHASHRAVLRRLGHAVPIAIAVFCIVYFGFQLLRGAL